MPGPIYEKIDFSQAFEPRGELPWFQVMRNPSTPGASAGSGSAARGAAELTDARGLSKAAPPTGGPVGSSAFADARLAREWKTVRAMVEIFCRGHHGAELCKDCEALLDYAALRLDRCRFGVEKPTCAKCPVHCYQRNRREQIREVMRYAGPRMLWRHPWLSVCHLWDGGRKVRLVTAETRPADGQLGAEIRNSKGQPS
jgi:hypothetical protein